MERSDIEKSFDLFYGLMDFDVKTGAPTEKSLKNTASTSRFRR